MDKFSSMEKLVVYLQGGEKKEINPSELSENTLQELMDFVQEAGGEMQSRENRTHLLLEWSDGWREVMEVGNRVENLARYYVIKRPEETGRLVLNIGDEEYPEMVEIFRKPRGLKKVTVI